MNYCCRFMKFSQVFIKLFIIIIVESVTTNFNFAVTFTKKFYHQFPLFLKLIYSLYNLTFLTLLFLVQIIFHYFIISLVGYITKLKNIYKLLFFNSVYNIFIFVYILYLFFFFLQNNFIKILSLRLNLTFLFNFLKV